MEHPARPASLALVLQFHLLIAGLLWLEQVGGAVNCFLWS
jgi:hypothetical protein